MHHAPLPQEKATNQCNFILFTGADIHLRATWVKFSYELTSMMKVPLLSLSKHNLDSYPRYRFQTRERQTDGRQNEQTQQDLTSCILSAWCSHNTSLLQQTIWSIGSFLLPRCLVLSGTSQSKLTVHEQRGWIWLRKYKVVWHQSYWDF